VFLKHSHIFEERYYENRTTEGKTLIKKNAGLFVDNKTLECRFILRQSESIPENTAIHKINLIVVLGKIALELNKMGKRIYLAGSVNYRTGQDKHEHIKSIQMMNPKFLC
jgi:hypothetical protein